MPVHLLFLTLYFSIQGEPEIDIIFALWQEKKTRIWIWSATGPDLKCSDDSLSEMRPRLKSHVDRAYHHRFMTYWAQADGGWFSLTRKNVLDSSLGVQAPRLHGCLRVAPQED